MGIVGRLRAGFMAFSKNQGYQSDSPRSHVPLDLSATKMALQSFSQPVWGPEISTLGAYAREGYTSKPFAIPFVPFSTQTLALATDEDVQLAINDLASKITGSDHYWKAIDDNVSNYMTDFSKRINFDIIDTTIVKELLWFGNSVWKPRLGIRNVQSADDLMHIPISSFVRIWWDRQRKPYKYEFRGPEYQGYHNPDDIIHLVWNPINANAFGTGFGVAMTSDRIFSQITPAGPVENKLPSMLDRKYSTQLTMHIAERRYTTRNVYVMPDSSSEERQAARADLADLKLGEDIVVGTKTEVQELGSAARAFNPQQWGELVMSPIFKALNDFRGKQAGESGHQFANAKTAALLDEIGLASFPITVVTQLVNKLFKPWYEANPVYSPNYASGLVSMPWEDCKFELDFGRVEKKDLDPAVALQALQTGFNLGVIMDPIEIRDILADIGLGLRKEYTEEMVQQLMLNQQISQLMRGGGVPQTGKGGNSFNTAGADLAKRPADNPNYNDHDNPTNRFPPKFDPQPSSPRLNWTQKKR